MIVLVVQHDHADARHFEATTQRYRPESTRLVRQGLRTIPEAAPYRAVKASAYPNGMSRRDRERIYEAQRAGRLRRLAEQEHLGDERPEAIVAGWEEEAGRQGIDRQSPTFWREADVWIASHRPR